MANKLRGEIKAELDGQEIILRLTTNAICEIEDADGRPINEIMTEISDIETMRMGTVRRMFWGMMLDAKPDATIQDAGALIDALRGRHTEVLHDAVKAAFPAANRGDASGN